MSVLHGLVFQVFRADASVFQTPHLLSFWKGKAGIRILQLNVRCFPFPMTARTRLDFPYSVYGFVQRNQCENRLCSFRLARSSLYRGPCRSMRSSFKSLLRRTCMDLLKLPRLFFIPVARNMIPRMFSGNKCMDKKLLTFFHTEGLHPCPLGADKGL